MKSMSQSASRISSTFSSFKLFFLLTIPTGLLFIAYGLAGRFAENPYSPVATFALMITFFAVATLMQKTIENPFSPTGRVFITLVFVMALRPMYLLFSGERLLIQGSPEAAFSEACLLLGLSLVLFCLGLRSRVVRRAAEILPLAVFRLGSREGVLARMSLLYAASWTVRLFLASKGIFHRQSVEGVALIPIMSWLAMVANWGTGVFVIVLGMYFTRRINWILPMLMLAMEMLAGIMNGGRMAMMYPLFWVATVYSLTRKPISWKVVAGGLVALVIVVGPMLTILRTALYGSVDVGGPINREAVTEAVDQAFSEAQGQNYLKSDLTQVVVKRLGTVFDSTMIVMSRVPRVYGFQEGDTFSHAFVDAFVPRVFYEKKPILSFARRVTMLFYDDSSSTMIGTFSTIGWPAELYFNFGWWGLAGMWVLGAMFGFLVIRFEAYRGEEGIAALWRYAAVIVSFASWDLTIEGIISGLPRFLWDMYLFYFIVSMNVPDFKFAGRARPPATVPASPAA